MVFFVFDVGLVIFWYFSGGFEEDMEVRVRCSGVFVEDFFIS